MESKSKKAAAADMENKEATLVSMGSESKSKKAAAADMENKEATLVSMGSEEYFLLCKGDKLQGRNLGKANLPPRRGEIMKKILASILVSLKPSKKSSSDSGKS